MPIRYERDDARRRIVVTTSGDVTADEVMSVIDRQIAEGAWTYAMLYDHSLALSLPPDDAVTVIVARTRQASEQLGPRGPIAAVTRDAEQFRRAPAFAWLEHSPDAVAFFSDRRSAEKWLAERR